MAGFILDLAAYLKRIDCPSDNLAADAATLAKLHYHHVQTVPFENLDVLLGQRISIDLVTVAEKIVRQHRGGYCFEQNTLFREVLQQLGFAVTPLLARVRWNVPAEVKTPLTHMVLKVDIAGESWLADVGFGAIGTTAPLRLGTTDEQSTTHEPRRIVQEGDIVTHQVCVGAVWRNVYQFSLIPPAPIDFELGNWFSCTHPRAMFVNNLVVSRVDPAGRHSIFNREYTWRTLDGQAHTSPIGSMEQMRTLLGEQFAIQLPDSSSFTIPSAPW